MSFIKNKEIIELGDVIILYINPSNMHQIEVKEKIKNKNGALVDNVFQTTYGALRIINLVGQKYGSKVTLSKGWAYVLQPTPELWTLTLPHRTQIIYTPDISMIIYLLDLIPGKIVIETGTGSGSLSHSLIRTIRPNGHLYTFDFHEQRVLLAQEEFKSHGIDEFVTAIHRDVCTEGFGNELDNKVDAVFLDLPHPWIPIDFAIKSIKKKGGKLCSFSPCIEQVQKTCKKLSSTGFIGIQTFECLQKELTVQQKNLPILDVTSWKFKSDENTKKFEDPLKLTTVSHPSSSPGHTGFITVAILPPEFARLTG